MPCVPVVIVLSNIYLQISSDCKISALGESCLSMHKRALSAIRRIDRTTRGCRSSERKSDGTERSYTGIVRWLVGCRVPQLPTRALTSRAFLLPSSELAFFESERSRHRVSVLADWDVYRQLKDR